MRIDLRTTFAREVRSLYELGAVGNLTDGDLLTRFVDREGDSAELAFSALVERHGAMVLHVCRSTLRDEHDAQDAFQATFLVLVRRAASIRNRDSLASWLYGTALRVSSCARAEASRRQARERTAASLRATIEEPVQNHSERDRALHDELAKLPERDRAPLVLCYLEGRTCEEAASELGWRVGTVKSRLSRARGRLQARLTRLGHHPHPSVVLPALRAAEVGSIARLTSAKSLVEGPSPAVLTLVRGALRTMMIQKAGVSALMGFLAVGLGFGLQGLASQATEAQDPPKPAVSTVSKPISAKFLSGLVLGPDGKPAGGAEVVLVDGHARYKPDNGEMVGRVKGKPLPKHDLVVRGRGRTDADGRFRFEVDATSSGENVRLMLWVYHEGDKLAWSEVDRPSLEKPKPLSIPLERLHSTNITVLDPDGQPVSNVRIVPTNTMKGRLSIPEPIRDLIARTTDANGQARIDALGRDEFWALRSYSDRFGMQQWKCEAGQFERGEPVMTLLPVGSLSGRIVDAQGKPLGATKLMVSTLAFGSIGPCTGVEERTTDADGKFSIAALPEGKLGLRFPSDKPDVADDYFPLEGVNIEGGRSLQIEIDRSKALPMQWP